MWCLVPLWLTLLLRAAWAAAEDASLGQIRGRISIPNKFQQDLPSGGGLAAAKVILDGGLRTVLPIADGTFFINGIFAGPHLLQVVHPTLSFDPVRVEASESGGALKMSAHMADQEQGRGAKLKYPLGLAPSGTFQYLEKREEFNIMTIFKNPMALISLFSVGAMFLLPKLQPMIEEEKERQKVEKDGNRGERVQDRG